jgi:anthranilate phosphoribosyltransferase
LNPRDSGLIVKRFLKILSEGGTLSETQAADAMRLLLGGDALPEETAGFLMGLRARGETLDELVGFTRVMREAAIAVELDDPHAIDLCGTGGDFSGTFNISTTVAFVCAGAGVTVAKHGNRSVSSQAGSADVLEALGVNTELRKEGVEACLRKTGIAFLFAPFFHPAMRHVMPVRRALGVRTFFNILGPLCNPAGVRRQLIGAFSIEVARQMAEILSRLDAEFAATVHADDGLDEISLATATNVFHARSGEDAVHSERIVPEAFGLARADLDAVRGGNAEVNADILRRVLTGESGPRRDIVLLNAAFGLFVSGKVTTLEEGLQTAAVAIDSGAAREKLEALIEISHTVGDT